MFRHLRRNAVAYLALVVALGTGSAYAAASIPNGSVTAAKLHTNAVTSTKIKNGTIKPKDIKKPTYVQSANLGARHTAGAVPDVVSVAPYDFTLPNQGPRPASPCSSRPSAANCDNGDTDQPTIGLYIDNVPIPAPRPTCRGRPTTGPIQLTATLELNGGAHTGRVGITCGGAAVRPNLNLAGREDLDDHPHRLSPSALMGA